MRKASEIFENYRSFKEILDANRKVISIKEFKKIIKENKKRNDKTKNK